MCQKNRPLDTVPPYTWLAERSAARVRVALKAASFIPHACASINSEDLSPLSIVLYIITIPFSRHSILIEKHFIFSRHRGKIN